MSKFIKYFVLLVNLIFIMVLSLNASADNGISTYPTYSGKGINITVQQLEKAGFTGVKADFTIDTRINSDRNYYPVFYFRVNEAVPGDQGKTWGDAANLVTVFVRQMPSGWVFNDGQMQETDLVGRTQAIVSKGEYYFEVIGPIHDNVINLIGILENSF